MSSDDSKPDEKKKVHPGPSSSWLGARRWISGDRTSRGTASAYSPGHDEHASSCTTARSPDGTHAPQACGRGTDAAHGRSAPPDGSLCRAEAPSAAPQHDREALELHSRPFREDGLLGPEIHLPQEVRQPSGLPGSVDRHGLPAPRHHGRPPNDLLRADPAGLRHLLLRLHERL